LWASADVSPDDVWNEMKRREGLFGIAEKIPKEHKTPPGAAPRRKVVALESRRMHKHR
jgi:phosphoribosyl-ATP pyrophosphohydrolase